MHDGLPEPLRLKKTVGRLATYLQGYGDLMVETNGWDPEVLARFRADSVVASFPGAIDGKADTAVVRDDDGDTWLFTDKNGDGRADVATEITRSGEVTMSEHRGDDWVEVEHGHIESDGRYVTDSKSGILDDSDDWFEEERFDGVVRIDSTTGQWISPN